MPAIAFDLLPRRAERVLRERPPFLVLRAIEIERAPQIGPPETEPQVAVLRPLAVEELERGSIAIILPEQHLDQHVDRRIALQPASLGLGWCVVAGRRLRLAAQLRQPVILIRVVA